MYGRRFGRQRRNAYWRSTCRLSSNLGSTRDERCWNASSPPSELERDRKRCEIRKHIRKAGKYIAGILSASSVVSFFVTFDVSYPELTDFARGTKDFWHLSIQVKSLLAFAVLVVVGLGMIALAACLYRRWGCHRFD